MISSLQVQVAQQEIRAAPPRSTRLASTAPARLVAGQQFGPRGRRRVPQAPPQVELPVQRPAQRRQHALGHEARRPPSAGVPRGPQVVVADLGVDRRETARIAMPVSCARASSTRAAATCTSKLLADRFPDQRRSAPRRGSGRCHRSSPRLPRRACGRRGLAAVARRNRKVRPPVAGAGAAAQEQRRAIPRSPPRRFTAPLPACVPPSAPPPRTGPAPVARPARVAASMPLNTAVPSEWRAAEPAPLATISGTTPRMNANEVIRIGRKRRRAPASAASAIGRFSFSALHAGEFHDENGVLRRQSQQHDQADLHVDVVHQPAQQRAEKRAEDSHRQPQKHAERNRPALVQRRQHQEHEHQRQARRSAPARRRPPPLLVGQPCPLEAEARRAASPSPAAPSRPAPAPSSRPAPPPRTPPPSDTDCSAAACRRRSSRAVRSTVESGTISPGPPRT